MSGRYLGYLIYLWEYFNISVFSNIQWNLPKVETIGVKISVRFLETLILSDFSLQRSKENRTSYRAVRFRPWPS